MYLGPDFRVTPLTSKKDADSNLKSQDLNQRPLLKMILKASFFLCPLVNNHHIHLRMANHIRGGRA